MVLNRLLDAVSVSTSTFAHVGLVLFSCTRPASGQALTSIVCDAGTDFLYNHLGQSPCLVLAYLGTPCSGGEFTVSPIAEDRVYVLSNGSATPCECNTVFYSMMAACSFCYGRDFNQWSRWITNCTQVVDDYPTAIPADTAVPSWAYANVTAINIWNPEVARQNSAPDSMAPQSTTSSTTTSETASTTSTTAVAVTTTVVTTSGSNNTGAIAGGVVGGVVGLGVIVIAVLWLLRKRKKSQTQSERDLLSEGSSTAPYSMPTTPAQDARLSPALQMRGGSLYLPPTSTGVSLQQPLSNVSQPQIYPPSGFLATDSLNPSSSSNMGMYRGVAEVQSSELR